MCRSIIIIGILLFLNLCSRGQDINGKFTFIYEVDSILDNVKRLKNDQIILYYPDGAVRYGLILWVKGNIRSGLAFKKPDNIFRVRKIRKKNIDRSSLLNQFADSFEIFKNYKSPGPYLISHDFNVIWVYSNPNMKSDTIVRPMSEIVGGSDSIGRAFFKKFEKLFDLSFSSRSSPFRRKEH